MMSAAVAGTTFRPTPFYTTLLDRDRRQGCSQPGRWPLRAYACETEAFPLVD